MIKNASLVGLFGLVLAGFFATAAFADAKKSDPKAPAAGKCVLKVTRTACPAKERESYSKCNGKQSCDVEDAATMAEDCAADALKACENTPDRQQITKSKVITALFGGQPVEKGKNFCAADRPDFNKCTK
jgi:hypothetical protein